MDAQRRPCGCKYACVLASINAHPRPKTKQTRTLQGIIYSISAPPSQGLPPPPSWPLSPSPSLSLPQSLPHALALALPPSLPTTTTMTTTYWVLRAPRTATVTGPVARPTRTLTMPREGSSESTGSTICVCARVRVIVCVYARVHLFYPNICKKISARNSLGCSSIMRAIEQKLFANRRCQRLVRGIFSTHPRWGDLSQTKNSLVYRTAFHVFRGTMRQGVILALQQVARKNPYLVHRLTTTHSPPPPSSSKYFDRVCCGDHP